MTKEQIIQELARLYRLREEGKNVSSLIAKYEAMLCEKMGCDDDEEDQDPD
jgi:hypothetical protein